MTATAVRVDGTLATVTFDRFTLDAYRLFLQAKRLPESQVSYDWQSDTYRLTTPARFAERLGAEAASPSRSTVPIAAHLFDYQRWIVQDLALPAKRFACWCDTGLGKTAMYLEWGRQVQAMTGGRVLIMAPLAVIPQICAEWQRFYPDLPILAHLTTREQVTTWCLTASRAGTGGLDIAITNYEKLIQGPIPEFRHLAGLVCDESSVLKSGGGTIKWNLIKSARGIEYKLSLTATPAPNDTMEYASQASFLEMMRSEGEIFWTYFTRNPKTDQWEVKPHARQAFYEFMASWSVYMRNPARFGFADILASLPDPDIRECELPLTDVQREMMHGLIGKKGGLFADDRLTLSERSKLAQLAAGFLYQTIGGKRQAARFPSVKPGWVAERTAEHVAAGRQTIIWTVFDEEGEIVAEHLSPTIRHAILTGKQTDGQRDTILRRFRSGELDVVISKPSLIGYGLNLQYVLAMIFSSFDDSFERIYQSIRRAFRFGQIDTVCVDFPHIPELQGTVFGNVKRKQRQFDTDTAIQEEHYRRVLMGGIA